MCVRGREKGREERQERKEGREGEGVLTNCSCI